MADAWPAPTPRDELLTQVVTTARRRMRGRRLAGLAASVGLVGVAFAGQQSGTQDAADLLAKAKAMEAVAITAAPVTSCPGDVETGALHRDERVYLTGRDGDGRWLELLSPSGNDETVWVKTANVKVGGDIDELPIHKCRTAGEELAVSDGTSTTDTSTTVAGDPSTTTSTVPGDTTTTSAGGTTPPTGGGTTTTSTPRSTTTTTRPTTTTTTTPPPDTSPPTIGAFSNGGVTSIIERLAGTCFGSSAPTSVIVSDQSGVSRVELRWRYVAKSGAIVTGMKPMALSSGLYRAALGTFPAPAAPTAGTIITWAVRAVDTKGNEATVTAPIAMRVTLHPCTG